MHVDIRALNIDNSESVNAHAQERIAAAFDRHAGRIASVDLRLEDTHGSKHGREMRCLVRVHITGAGAVTIEQRGPDVFRAIDEATRRARRAVKRQINRSRLFEHDRIAQRDAA